MKIENPIYDDWFLLKFCRARKFKIDDVVMMFEKMIQFRARLGIDTLLADYEKHEEVHKKFKTWTQSAYFCIAKDGRPVRIDRWKYWQGKTLASELSSDEKPTL